jgi:hypothetical protein
LGQERIYVSEDPKRVVVTLTDRLRPDALVVSDAISDLPEPDTGSSSVTNWRSGA